jgi:hypothetical protein
VIRLPQRSVTRFFIPLIDVLTLLFCIFLVMPIISVPEDQRSGDAAAAREEEVRRLKEDLERLRQQSPDLSERLQAELERLRREKIQTLKERIALRVLEIDATTGKLYYRDPERVEVRDQADALRLIDRDRRERGVGRRELYYVILYPRDPNSSYPTQAQRRAYENWFSGVALAFDVPGSGPAEGRGP